MFFQLTWPNFSINMVENVEKALFNNSHKTLCFSDFVVSLTILGPVSSSHELVTDF